MNKAEIIRTLRDHQVELGEAGVLHLALFGSVARNEAGEASDIDLMADFDAAKRLSLVRVIGIKHRLEDILGREVDLAQAKNLRPSVRERALREAVVAF